MNDNLLEELVKLQKQVESLENTAKIMERYDIMAALLRADVALLEAQLIAQKRGLWK